MKTNVEPLENNRVKLSVEVDETEFERALDQAFRRIAREVRIPGFRPGKAPRRILEARIGTDVARQEALREALPGYYARAVRDTDVDVIAPPEIDLTGGQDDGPVAFDAVVEVRPQVSVPGYGSLRVTVPAPTVTDEEVDAQVDRLRGQHGELRQVDRPARDGDHVTIDIAGSVDGEPVEGLTADDYLYEVGTGAPLPEIDEHLRGAKVGDILAFTARPDPEEDEISFRILVKDVKEKVLPDVTDEWANEASEFDTVAELRADLTSRMASVKRVQAQMALQQGAVESLVALVEDEPPEALVNTEMERRAHDLMHRLQGQGVTLEQYLEATGRSADELSAELRSGAVSAVRADLALRAVADTEGIEVTDDDVEAEIAKLAVRMNEKPAALRRQLERAEQLPSLRSDVRKGKALSWLVDHAEIVDEEGRPVERSAIEPEPSDDADQSDDPDQPGAELHPGPAADPDGGAEGAPPEAPVTDDIAATAQDAQNPAEETSGGAPVGAGPPPSEERTP